MRNRKNIFGFRVRFFLALYSQRSQPFWKNLTCEFNQLELELTFVSDSVVMLTEEFSVVYPNMVWVIFKLRRSCFTTLKSIYIAFCFALSCKKIYFWKDKLLLLCMKCYSVSHLVYGLGLGYSCSSGLMEWSLLCHGDWLMMVKMCCCT